MSSMFQALYVGNVGDGFALNFLSPNTMLKFVDISACYIFYNCVFLLLKALNSCSLDVRTLLINKL